MGKTTMIASTVRATLFAVGALGALVSCASTPPPSSIGSNISATYTAPTSYQDHRDQQRSYTSSSGQIAYTDHGEGAVLVLLHGVPTSSWMYRKIMPELQTSMRVISIDHLGFGSSAKPDQDTGYAATDHAGRAQELLASLGITDYSLMIHDMGGLVAWEMLRANPDAVSHLIILNTIVNDEGFKEPDLKPGAFTRTLMDGFTSPLTSVAVLTKTFADLGLRGANKLSELECFGYVLPMREGADPALYQFFTGINDDLFARLEENRTLFENYKGETLVMWGAQDETLTVGQIPILQEMLNVPDENIHIYQDNAHFLAEEIPDEVVARVTEFLN